MSDHNQDVAARLQKLERENLRLARETRRLKLLGLALASCIGITILGAANQDLPDFQGRSLTIRDNNNVARITLGFNNAGAAQILLNDNQGKVHAQLVSTANGEVSALNLTDIDGQMKANLFVSREGQGMTANGRKVP